MEYEGKKHFVLVHGACHGGWCWYKVATLLRAAGHRVTAPDLGASGIDTRQVCDLASFSDYAKPVLDIIGSVSPEERVILVGHSFGGYSLGLAMESFPNKIAAAVLVTALMPKPASVPTHVLDQDLTLATMLIRWVNFFRDDLSHESMLSEKKYGSVSNVYIVCKEVEAITEDLQRWMIENNPVKEVKEIEGSDHMPMLSKPEELCFSLLEISQKYS